MERGAAGICQCQLRRGAHGANGLRPKRYVSSGRRGGWGLKFDSAAEEVEAAIAVKVPYLCLRIIVGHGFELWRGWEDPIAIAQKDALAGDQIHFTVSVKIRGVDREGAGKIRLAGFRGESPISVAQKHF